jgi:GTP-dependent dephospho-CoA kinase
MTIVYSITLELRAKLKEPFGFLIKGSFDQTMSELKVLISQEKPPKLVAVGDTVSKNFHDYKFCPDLSIVDYQCMRKKIKPLPDDSGETLHIVNPQGTITDAAVEAIKESLQSQKHVHIVVDGEEDLLTLIAVLYAPLGSLVVYGQPYEGIVIVQVTEEKKVETLEILKAMEKGSKS